MKSLAKHIKFLTKETDPDTDQRLCQRPTQPDLSLLKPVIAQEMSDKAADRPDERTPDCRNHCQNPHSRLQIGICHRAGDLNLRDYRKQKRSDHRPRHPFYQIFCIHLLKSISVSLKICNSIAQGIPFHK